MTPPLIQLGLQYWGVGNYFQAHQAWENHWHTIRKDPEKREEADHVKGMIQLAVALVHHERGNEEWRDKLLGSGPQLMGARQFYEQARPSDLIEHAQKRASYKP